jgi:hypothetical protein
MIMSPRAQRHETPFSFFHLWSITTMTRTLVRQCGSLTGAPRIQTTDAAQARIRSRDALLTPPTAEELAANQRRTASMTGLDLGLRWEGNLKPVGQAVAAVIDALKRVTDKRAARDALGMATVELAAFGGELESSEAGNAQYGTVNFSGNDEANGGREEDINGHAVRSNDGGRITRITGDFGATQSPDEINEINRAHYARAGTQDTTVRCGRPTPDSINAANRAFYGNASTAPVRTWGKG